MAGQRTFCTAKVRITWAHTPGDHDEVGFDAPPRFSTITVCPQHFLEAMSATTIALQAFAGATIAMLAAFAIADTGYPSRPIRIVTPYAPGGSTTITGRLLGEHFTSRCGRT